MWQIDAPAQPPSRTGIGSGRPLTAATRDKTTHAGPRGTTTVEDRGSWDPTTRTWTRVKVVTRPDGSTEKTEVSTEVTPTP
jgi:hypothetical protein